MTAFDELERQLRSAVGETAGRRRRWSIPARFPAHAARTALLMLFVVGVVAIANVVRTGDPAEVDVQRPATAPPISTPCTGEAEQLPSTNDAAPADVVLKRFGVFRNPPASGEPADFDWASQVSGPTIIGINIGWGRELGTVDGVRFLAVPVTDLPKQAIGQDGDCGQSPEPAGDISHTRPGICYADVVADSELGFGCQSVERVEAGWTIGPAFLGDERAGSMLWRGLAPDGVVQVEFRPRGSKEPTVADVRDNFFAVRVRGTQDDVLTRGRIIFRETDGTERDVSVSRRRGCPGACRG